MIRTIPADNVREYTGLSTDSKPTKVSSNVGGGSTFLEIDTGKVFVYDEENDRWLEL